MKWPLTSKPTAEHEIPLFNRLYLHARGDGGPDPTIGWLTEVSWDSISSFLTQQNSQLPLMVTPAHLLIRSVAESLRRHPELNRRVVGRKLRDFRAVNVCLATRTNSDREVHPVLIERADELSIADIATRLWEKQLELRRASAKELKDRKRMARLPGWVFRRVMRTYDQLDRWFALPIVSRLDRYRNSPVLVNDFTFAGAPLMRGYKPSRFPDQSKTINVTLGPPEEKVVWQDNQAQPIKVAPLSVRIDHRICDGFELAKFVSTLSTVLNSPSVLSSTGEPPTADEIEQQVGDVNDRSSDTTVPLNHDEDLSWRRTA